MSGPAVTILVGYVPDAQSPARAGLKWQFEEHWSGEIARFAGAGFVVRVKDCDGDASRWTVRRHGRLLAEGENDGWEPYHFDACLLAAEAALREAVRSRKAELREAQAT